MAPRTIDRTNLMRTRHFALALLLPALTACRPAVESVPAPAAESTAQYDISVFLDVEEVRGGFISPDNGKVLIHSDRTGVFNAYSVSTGQGDVSTTALTDSVEDAVHTVGYFPGDERFLFRSDEGGNELDHIFVRELDGSVKDLTPGEKLKAEFVKWAEDGASFFLATTERDRRYFDLYEYSVDGYQREMVFKNDEAFDVVDVSADRRYVALGKANDRKDADVYLHDRETGRTHRLSPDEGEILEEAQVFGPDSKSLFLTTDRDSEFSYLERLDLESGERVVVEKPGWEVSDVESSPRGTYLIVEINHDSRDRVKVLETATLSPLELPATEAHITKVRFSTDESHMLWEASVNGGPDDFYVHDFKGQARRLTRSLSEEIIAEDLVEGEVVRFASFDGVEVPGVLYKPHAASPENKLPALVWVHGGPGGQSMVGYHALIQYLVNHEYVVFAINNRGSSGYGKTFFALDDGAHGEGDLDDCVTSKQMLIDTGYVDPQRIGIIGGSYGGYMVLAALAFRPEEFDVGVDIFGVSNWLRTLQSIPPWWEAIREALQQEMGDFDDEEYMKSISPLFHAKNIVKPLIVLQGANDPRVLQVESDEIVEAVRANGVPVEYVVFEDEGHGFEKKSNRERGYKAILDFLDKHLKKGM